MSQEGAIPPSKGGDGTDLKKWITEYAEQVKQVVVDFQGILSNQRMICYLLIN